MAGIDQRDGLNGVEVHKPAEGMTVEEKAAFDALIRPDDCYTPEGVYWADLSLFKRLSFVSGNESREAKRELGVIGSMMKKDPLSPIPWYFKNMVLPGAGLGLEGYVFVFLFSKSEANILSRYVLFSIGNLKPLFESLWPECWDEETVCNPNWVDSVTYLEVCGIIVGQILVGLLGDWYVLFLIKS